MVLIRLKKNKSYTIKYAKKKYTKQAISITIKKTRFIE
jgi:hypothetical protein